MASISSVPATGTVRRIFRNVVSLYAAQAVSSLLGFFLVVLIARILGDAQLGVYSFAMAIAGIAAVVLDLGFNTLIVRELARDKSQAPRFLGNIILIRTISLAVMLLIFFAIAYGFPRTPETSLVLMILGAYVFVTSFATIFRGAFRAFEKMQYEAFAVIVSRITGVSLALAALFLHRGLVVVALALLFGGFLDLALSALICRVKFVRPSFQIDLPSWGSMVRNALPIGFLFLAEVIFVRIDTVMLSQMKGDAVVGWYNAAYNLVLALKPIPIIFSSTMLPLMSRFSVASGDSLRTAIERLFRYLLFLGLPIAAGTILLADQLIPLFYGSEYAKSVIALKILAGDVLLYFLYLPLGMLLISIDKQNQMALSTILCALLNVFLNLVLIPRYSFVGAGIATLVTEATLLILYFILARQSHRISLGKVAVKPLVACSAMVLLLYFFDFGNVAISLALAATTYFVVLGLAKGFSRDDLDSLRKLLPGRANSRS